MSTAKIDVVMAVYNAEAYLAEAVRSILNQTFEDFRLICIDDGSTDGSLGILKYLAQKDARVEVVTKSNRGVVHTANTGLAMCEAPYVARMDSDDIAMPQRFARQVEYLDSHPNVVALGTGILEIDSDGDPLTRQFFHAEHEQLDLEMQQLKTPIANPSAMMRREAVQAVGGYREGFEWGEDLDLWIRLVEHGRLANLQEILLCYRQHPLSICRTISEESKSRALRMLQESFASRGLTLSDKLIERSISNRSPGSPAKWARKASKQGQWSAVYKHMRRQWQESPLSLLTWRMTAEVALRSVVTRMGRRAVELPEVPKYRQAA